MTNISNESNTKGKTDATKLFSFSFLELNNTTLKRKLQQKSWMFVDALEVMYA
jgi:hypothetical protein